MSANNKLPLLISAEASKLWDHEPYGKDTIEPGSDRLARRPTATGVGAQTRGLEAAGHSPRFGREQGCGESMDEAGQAGGRRSSQAQASSRCSGAPQRRTTSQTTRASGTRSTCSWL